LTEVQLRSAMEAERDDAVINLAEISEREAVKIVL
jgi:hypothetical protein